MYPYLKLAKTIYQARKKAPLTLEQEATLNLRVGITDADLFMELNNARFLSYMELGRWDLSYRNGFGQIMKERSWGVAVGGANIRYRRRIPIFKRFELKSKIICHDGRWFYFLQEAHVNEKISASGVIKVGVVNRKGLIEVDEVLKSMDREDWGHEIPGWIQAWITAEGQRPWPSQ